MRVIVSGNNDVATGISEWLYVQGEKIVGLIPEGRDIVDTKKSWERPFKPFAKNLGEKMNIPVYVGNPNKYTEEIRSLNPDLIAFCRGISLIKKPILEIPSIGCTNLHYGELPRYGGCSTIQWAILNGEDRIGVTLHYMTENFDEGPIIDQRTFDITKGKRSLTLPKKRKMKIYGMTAFEAYIKSNETAKKMFCENYNLIKNGNVKTTSQNLSKQLYFSKDKLDFTRDKYLELGGASYEKISRHIRAFTFPPKQFPEGILNGKNIGELVLK